MGGSVQDGDSSKSDSSKVVSFCIEDTSSSMGQQMDHPRSAGMMSGAHTYLSDHEALMEHVADLSQDASDREPDNQAPE